MARPTKLTPEVQEKIVDAILHGATKKDAALCAGIHYDTFNEWMKKGEKATRGKFSEFSEAVTIAEAQCSVNHDRIITSAAAKGDWRASLEWKKRRRREDWGDNVNVTSGGALKVIIEYADDKDTTP